MAVDEKTRWKVRDLTPRIGSEIETDIDTLLSGKVSERIRALLEERGVLLAGQQPLFEQVLVV